MAHRTLVRYALGLLLALPVAACGAGPGVDDTAAEAGVSSAQDGSADQSTAAESAGTAGGNGSSAGAEPGTGGGSGSGGGGLPGGPGADPADGGGGGDGGAVAQGNPGAPGDVSVFEERGVSYAEFREGSAQRVCVDEGKCTLTPPHDPEGTYGDPAQCPIEGMEYSTGTHRNAEGQLVFLEGATVTVTVSCLRFTDPDGDGVPGDSTVPDTTGDGTTPDTTADEGTTPDTSDETTDDTTDDDTAPVVGDPPPG